MGAKVHKPRRKYNAPYNNRELQLSKLKGKTVNNVLSFIISSSPKNEQSRDRHSDDARNIFSQHHQYHSFTKQSSIKCVAVLL